MIKRKLADVLIKSKSILLLGPRQVGKSTLISSLKPDIIINLANEKLFLRISNEIEYFESLIEGKKNIFVDEIQRIPSLLNTIQDIVDNNKKIVFYLTGSSARKLKRGQANLLPGRVISYKLLGLAASELNYDIDINKALSYGFLPEIYLSKDRSFVETLLDSYVSTYLKEEIQAEALTRNLQNFVRFINVIAEYSGSILDFSKISTKSKVSRSSIVRFIEILEDTLIASRIEVFDLTDEADIIRHPKFYFFDPGVLNALLESYTVSKDRLGLLFKHVVYAQLKNSAATLNEKIEITYFRTRNGVEVDFIVKLRNKHYAIEVNSTDVSKSDLSNLKIFRNYYPQVESCIIVSPKEKKRTLDQILICNLIDLLKHLKL